MRFLFYFLALPHIVCYLLLRSHIPEIDSDLISFSGGVKGVKPFVKQIVKKEYRNVFYLRIPFLLRHFLNFILPRERNLYLHTLGIGRGLHVVHGFSTIVVAERIGKNFTVYQNFTVGWEKTGKPIIGDNVTIYAGAVVSGGIKIGNNVRVCANAHVRQDVPDNSIVYGNPCVIKRIN